jgi:predicted 3-demethylubiquinone-9 3-methyltransferase (glyoxalase superfamily)
MEGITPFLWFDNQAGEAMEFYTSLFPNSRIVETMPGPDGNLLAGTFMLDGREYMALNGGPEFKFTEAISLFVKCQDQAEVDHYWDALTADGGEESQCGWLKDRYGLSWQIVPNRLMELLGDPNRETAGRATQAMLKMQKIDVAKLEEAAAAG